MVEPVHISDDELKKMHACAPMLEPPAGDELRRVIDQVLAERRETARLRALAASWIRTARVLAIDNLRRGTPKELPTRRSPTWAKCHDRAEGGSLLLSRVR